MTHEIGTYIFLEIKSSHKEVLSREFLLLPIIASYNQM